MSTANSMTSKTGPAAIRKIKQKLQIFYTVLKKSVEVWKDCETCCKTCLEKLENLSDQYQCCIQVSVQNLLPEFPDVKDRLLFKLYTVVEEQVTKIQKELSTLEDTSSQLMKQSDLVMSVYRGYKSDISVRALAEKSAVCPSVAQMLEWANNSSLLFKQMVLAKQFLVEEWTPGQPESLSVLTQSWGSGDQDLMDTFDSYLSYTAYFLQEDLS